MKKLWYIRGSPSIQSHIIPTKGSFSRSLRYVLKGSKMIRDCLGIISQKYAKILISKALIKSSITTSKGSMRLPTNFLNEQKIFKKPNLCTVSVYSDILYYVCNIDVCFPIYLCKLSDCLSIITFELD